MFDVGSTVAGVPLARSQTPSSIAVLSFQISKVGAKQRCSLQRQFTAKTCRVQLKSAACYELNMYMTKLHFQPDNWHLVLAAL
jgi:hypothetical protein